VRPGVKVIAAEPDNSALLASGIRQPRRPDGTASESHPRFRPHLMQGWAPDFVSHLTEAAVDGGLIDEIVPVAGSEALMLARALATQEGIFVGTSSGATLAAALTVARRSPPGTNIVCMLPDTGERYLSTPQPVKAEVTPIEVDAEAARFVSTIVKDKPVVMFALEWCEFCWSARKLFKRLGIDYHSVDLDSVRYQQDDLGGRIRAAVARDTGARTIPQVFVGGKHIGGCTDLFDAWRGGTLKKLMDEKGIAYRKDVDIDPYTLLPKWLQPRKSA
jgi:cysteine synthase A